MELKKIEIDNGCILELIDERLDVKSVPQFRELLEPEIINNTLIILDLSNTLFVDSTGVGALLQLLKKLKAAGSTLKLCGIQDQVDAMFKLVHMDTMFDISKNTDDIVKEHN